MRYQRLDLNLLTALRVLLRERNVTRAAEALHVTQPAVSGMLARLREYFDDPLIVSVGRRMELSPLGETLAGEISDVMLKVDTLLSVRPAFDPATSRRCFSIIASDYTVEVLMLGVMRELDRQAPGVTLAFHEPSQAASTQLDNGEVDFVITPRLFGSPHQAAVLLFEDSYHGLVDRDNTAVGERVSLAEYKALHHVSMEHEGRPLFESWLAGLHGLPEQRNVLINGFSLLPQLVIGTRRIATLHARMAVQAVQRWPVRRVLLDFELPQFQELLQWHRYRELDPGSQWLREKIVAHAHALPAPPLLPSGP